MIQGTKDVRGYSVIGRCKLLGFFSGEKYEVGVIRDWKIFRDVFLSMLCVSNVQIPYGNRVFHSDFPVITIDLYTYDTSYRTPSVTTYSPTNDDLRFSVYF